VETKSDKEVNRDGESSWEEVCCEEIGSEFIVTRGGKGTVHCLRSTDGIKK